MKNHGESHKSVKSPDNLFHKIIWIGILAAAILLVPLLAMQITSEVAWDKADFIAAWILLFSAGLTYILVTERVKNSAYRTAAGVAVIAALLLVWLNLAVGLTGSEENAYNLIYFGVLAIIFAGALIVRFQPVGMSRVLFATAITQALVAGIALIILMPFTHQEPAIKILAVNGFFIALWMLSALMFRRAAREAEFV